MPLQSGSSKEIVSNNIKELYSANAGKDKPRSRDQMIAIAMANARRTAPGTDRYRKKEK